MSVQETDLGIWELQGIARLINRTISDYGNPMTMGDVFDGASNA
jgi:hypothetical protein